MITQSQTEAIFAVEHANQCIHDLITAIERASNKWQEQAFDYKDYLGVQEELTTLKAFALILRNCSFPSLKVNHIIAQHLEEF